MDDHLLDLRKLIVAQSPATSEYVRGALYGLAAVSIWAGFIVVARFGIRTSLTPWEIAAIRFTVSGSLLPLRDP